MDAFDYAVSMVLAQMMHEDRECVKAYGGWTVNRRERNYGITEKEALTVLQGIHQFDPTYVTQPLIL